MKFYNDAYELVQKELPMNIISHIYPFFYVGEKAFKDTISDDMFKSKMISNFAAGLLEFCIYVQFEKDMISKKFPFKTKTIKVNNFGRRVIELRRKKIIIHIARSSGPFKLPYESNYKKEKAHLNRFLERQLVYFTSKNTNNLYLDEEAYYAIIIYGGKNYSVDFVNLIIPDERMTNILESVDLKQNFVLYKNNKQLLREQEKKLPKLKKEVKEKFIVKLKDDLNET